MSTIDASGSPPSPNAFPPNIDFSKPPPCVVQGPPVIDNPSRSLSTSGSTRKNTTNLTPNEHRTSTLLNNNATHGSISPWIDGVPSGNNRTAQQNEHGGVNSSCSKRSLGSFGFGSTKRGRY